MKLGNFTRFYEILLLIRGFLYYLEVSQIQSSKQGRFSNHSACYVGKETYPSPGLI